MGAAMLAKKHDLPVFVSDMGPISAAAKQELIKLELRSFPKLNLLLDIVQVEL